MRFIDAFVDDLDLSALKFTRLKPDATGSPPYSVRTLLKLYVYGHLNRIRSSRRLERECRRNIELWWLLDRLCPDHNTIAIFRAANPAQMMGAASGQNRWLILSICMIIILCNRMRHVNRLGSSFIKTNRQNVLFTFWRFTLRGCINTKFLMTNLKTIVVNADVLRSWQYHGKALKSKE